MKLILCGKCWDMVELRAEWRTCHCGKSSGLYLGLGTTVEVEIKGPCLVLGVDNNELRDAINRYLVGMDRAAFTAFIFIPQIGEGKFNALPKDLENDPNPEKAFLRRPAYD